MKTQIDNKMRYNIGLFLINYAIFFIINFNFLHHHIAHKNPIGFLISVGLVGLLITLGMSGLRTYIPVKILIINLVSTVASVFIVTALSDSVICHGIACSDNFWDFIISIGAGMVYLFFSLKFYVILPAITVIYLVMVWQSHYVSSTKN